MLLSAYREYNYNRSSLQKVLHFTLSCLISIMIQKGGERQQSSLLTKVETEADRDQGLVRSHHASLCLHGKDSEAYASACPRLLFTPPRPLPTGNFSTLHGIQLPLSTFATEGGPFSCCSVLQGPQGWQLWKMAQPFLSHFFFTSFIKFILIAITVSSSSSPHAPSPNLPHPTPNPSPTQKG